MKLFWKWLRVPKTNEVKKLKTVRLWYVSWWSVHGMFTSDRTKETEAFTSEREAEEFAQSLRNAFVLLKYRFGTKVVVEKRD